MQNKAKNSQNLREFFGKFCKFFAKNAINSQKIYRISKISKALKMRVSMKKFCLILSLFCFIACEKAPQKPATRHFDDNVSLEKSEQSADINESVVPLPVPDLSHFKPHLKGVNFLYKKSIESVNFLDKKGVKDVNFLAKKNSQKIHKFSPKFSLQAPQPKPSQTPIKASFYELL